MSKAYYIVDTELPISQNFRLLKEEGLAYIQAISGNEWTNLNTSDPGVTILDQLCYALTELGYCNDFPVKDILTDKDNRLKVKHQFYHPDGILTTTPITIVDYRKYVIDGIDGVKNVIITPVKKGCCSLNGVYRTYFLKKPSLTNTKAIESLPDEVFYLLNTARNLSESFLLPQPLSSKACSLSGRIDIESINSLGYLLEQLQECINNFIFPSVPQYGYDELLELGETTNDVFSGPILKNGWIRNEELGDKKNCVRLVDINGLVNSVEGVIPNAILAFDGDLAAKDMSSEDYEILVFDVLDDLKQSRLSIYCNNTKVENKALQNAITYAERAIKSEKNFSGVTTVKTKPKLPKGAYRDIETYYSIQNTFPSIFGVGEHSVKSNASNFEIAQSRQLKGYLTLFDQILANQFSQLANIDKLFSFKNNLTGATSDFERFYAKRDTFDKKHPGFPAPYELFSATYFYQSLYNVPYIRPLLKDNEKFDFSFTPESDKVAQQKSWKEYKDDPYNPYMWALLTHTADDKTNYQRRDTLLDHLLARHGESPEVINLLIEGTTYTLDPVMDRVIIKSLLLQNLEKLSYNAPKGYNYLAADSLQFKVVGDFRELLMPVPPYRYTKDFIFRSKKVDHIEKINPQDVINCSSFELKLNLLFGLRVKYSDFYVANFDQHKVNEELALSQWFMNARRGAIVLETNLLFLPAQFQLAITSADEPDTFYYSQTGLTFDEAILIGNSINFAMDEELTKHVTKGSITVQNKLYPISKEENKDWPKHWFRPTQQGGYRVAIEVRWDDQTFTYIKDPKFNDNLDVFFPTFISEMGSQAFINKFDLLAENSLPISLRANYYFKDTVWFMTFIPIWVKWLNSMRYKSDSENDSTVLLKSTTLLASQIIKLPIRYND